jgi:hypothetical protein
LWRLGTFEFSMCLHLCNIPEFSKFWNKKLN